jgi:hypothetical protein
MPLIHTLVYVSTIASTRELQRLYLQVPVRVKWKLEQRGARNYLTIIHTIRTNCNKEKDHAA